MSKKKVAILSNVTADMIIAKLRMKYDVYTTSGYDTWIPEVVNSRSLLYTQEVDGIFILLDGTESQGWKDCSKAEERICLWEQGVNKLAEEIKEVPIFISTLDVRMNRVLSMSEINISHIIEGKWLKVVQNIIKNHSNCFIYDLKEIITDVGRRFFYSEKMWYMGNMPFSRDGIQKIVDDIDEMMTCYYEAAKKVIVLDLDNTLWGGVIGEDGVEGIELSDHNQGQRFYDFQWRLLEMKKRGALLVINSKNNLEDVKKVFDEHPYMLLKWNDFAVKKINWQSKVQNIRELETELNLSEESFVFVDDNPIEREIVAGECPGVTVLDFPEDTTQLSVFAEDFYNRFLKLPRVLSEDTKRTEMYLAEKKRKSEISKFLNLDEYISKLEMKVTIHRMTDKEQERVVQLCNKTNQFNVTTKRYTKKDILEMAMNSGIEIYTAFSRDKYAEAGLISVVIIKRSGTIAVIDTFLMSCRVMGRKLEYVIIGEIIENLKNQGLVKVLAEYIPTAKNAPVRGLFDTLEFMVIDEDKGIKKYELDLMKWSKPENNIYKTVDFQAE